MYPNESCFVFSLSQCFKGILCINSSNELKISEYLFSVYLIVKLSILNLAKSNRFYRFGTIIVKYIFANQIKEFIYQSQPYQSQEPFLSLMKMQQDEVLGNLSHIDAPESKKHQAYSLAILTKQLGIREIASFLAGYVIAELKLALNSKETAFVVKNLNESLDLVRDRILEIRNLIQATVEGIDQVKKSQVAFQSQLKKKPSNKNGYMFEEKMVSQKRQSSVELFLQSFSTSISQLALDHEYLNSVWSRELIQEEEDRKSRDIINQMLAEEKQKKMEEENKKLECQICLVEIDFEEMGAVEGCKHIFHRQCLHQHIKAAVLSSKVEISCPMEGCTNILTVNDIQSYIQGQLLDKFYKFSLNKYVEDNNGMTSWCPTAGCPALFEFDEGLDNYRCPTCRKHYCLKCRCEYHYGMSCAEYRISNTFSQDDKKFEEFVRGAKFKQCPKCKFWVERIEGCSTMSCRCGVEFCYDCGGTGCPHGMCTGSGRNNGEGPPANNDGGRFFMGVLRPGGNPGRRGGRKR